MGRSEKLPFKELDEELLEFHKYLRNNNFDDEEIRKIFQPLFDDKKPVRKYIFLFTLISFILLTFLKTQTGWLYFLAFSRIFLLQIKPFYDWSHLKNQECLVSKWWEEKIVANYTPNCNFCENLFDLELMDRLEGEDLEELYLDVHKPVVLRYNGFPSGDQLWSGILQDGYLSSYPCSLETNVMEKDGNIGKLLRKTSIFSNFFVLFQNCDLEGMKYFRSLVPIPDLIPGHLSPVQYNWLLYSRNYTISRFKKIELVHSENVKMICQLDGDVIYRLTPPESCRETCSEIEVKLEKDQVMVVTNFWGVEYKFNGGSVEKVAVIHETHAVL